MDLNFGFKVSEAIFYASTSIVLFLNPDEIRDYMIAHTEDAHKYSELKRKLAKQYPNDIIGYMDGMGKMGLSKRCKGKHCYGGHLKKLNNTIYFIHLY
ncbi:MAG: GrpB family protein [Nostoc sp. ChiQUE02]|uniref:GrpB family protein n=1 Tax=Nostoc sp. ChiQUE02 TaxID=3075377 RepID=UPI003D161F34